MIFVPFLTAFLAALVLTPLVILLAKKYNVVDDPKKHLHPAILHKKIIPRAGGVAIFLAFLIATILVAPLSKKLLGIFFGGSILVFLGIIDDIFDFRNYWKLAVQILASLVVIGFGVGITFITNPFYFLGLGTNFGEVIKLDILRITFDFLGRHSILVWADLFALFWIVWVINMVNFSSGVDGQMPGIATVALMVIFATSLRFLPNDPNQILVSQLALAGAGATLGFLIFNFYPAKIFPGDSGSYFLGFLIATLAILSGAKVGTAIMVMAIPLVDGAFTIMRRIASGQSPFKGDSKHLHHRLLELGWGQRRISLFYWLLCAILGAAALVLPAIQKLFAGVVVTVIILGGLLWLNMSLPQKAQE